MLTVRNKLDTLQIISERHNQIDEYENVVTAHREAASEFIPTKPRNKSRVGWESLVVLKKAIS